MIEHVAALGFVGIDFKWQDVKKNNPPFPLPQITPLILL